MSNLVFPVLAGIAFPVKKRPIFRTIVQETVSGKELRIALMSFPLWQFSLSFNVLRTAAALLEYQTLQGFFNKLLGSFDTFLYTDPTDNSVTNEPFGTGDGVTKSFQLIRSLGGFLEPIQNVNGTPSVLIAGVVQIQAGVLNALLGAEPLLSINSAASNKFAINSTGLVTFQNAPAIGATLTWTGSFYYRCRMLQDEADFVNLGDQIWELQKLEFQSVKL